MILRVESTQGTRMLYSAQNTISTSSTAIIIRYQTVEWTCYVSPASNCWRNDFLQSTWRFYVRITEDEMAGSFLLFISSARKDISGGIYSPSRCAWRFAHCTTTYICRLYFPQIWTSSPHYLCYLSENIPNVNKSSTKNTEIKTHICWNVKRSYQASRIVFQEGLPMISGLTTKIFNQVQKFPFGLKNWHSRLNIIISIMKCTVWGPLAIFTSLKQSSGE